MRARPLALLLLLAAPAADAQADAAVHAATAPGTPALAPNPTPTLPPPPMLAPPSATPPTASANLLSVARVTKADGVQRVEVMTDGKASTDGEIWNSPMAGILPTKGAVEWDLGQVVPIEAGLIQADNNDDYLVWGSDDGTDWKLIWRAGPYSHDGLRTRTQGNLAAHARFIRLTGEGGDNMYSIGELQLYASGSTLANPPLARRAPPPPPPPPCNPSWPVLGGMAMAMFLFFTRRREAPPKA